MKEIQELSDGLYEVRIREKLNFQYSDYGFHNGKEKLHQAWIEANHPPEREANDPS